MKSAYDIIKRPIITEKSSGFVDKLQYTFEVAVDANKVEIKKAIEAAFGVKVEKVNTLNTKAKSKRVGRYTGKTKTYKKAFVTLKDGETIEL